MQGGRGRAGHERVPPAVDDELDEIADHGAIDERVAIRVDPGWLEDAALDSASKLTGRDPGSADLARRDHAVLTCRDVRQPAELLGHGPHSSRGVRE